jgi:uncharacterized protein (TIGR02246 family)
MSNSNAQLVREMYKSFQRGDLEAVLNSMTQEVTWTVPGAAPFSGTRNGREQVRQFFREMSQAVQMEQFQVDEVLADADKVVALGRQQAIVRATGRHLDFSWVHIYTIRDRKVAAANMFNDSMSTAADFGVVAKAAG